MIAPLNFVLVNLRITFFREHVLVTTPVHKHHDPNFPSINHFTEIVNPFEPYEPDGFIIRLIRIKKNR